TLPLCGWLGPTTAIFRVASPIVASHLTISLGEGRPSLRRVGPMPTPAEVLTALNSRDSAAPRITCYDDVPGPTAGERIELSGRVLGTWVSKAGNALQEEWDIEPGSVVRLTMQPHWRLLYWAWATWTVGALVDL